VVCCIALFQDFPEETQKNEETIPVRITDFREDVSSRDLCPFAS
jgi:hypothetical protein